MSAATVWKRMPTSNVCKSAFRRFPPLFLAAHGKQTCSLRSTSNRSFGHQKRFLTLLKVFSRWKCSPLTGDACSWSKISSLQEDSTTNSRWSPSAFSFLRYKSPFLMSSSSQWDQYANSISPYLVASALVTRFVPRLEQSSLLASSAQ